jgi:hypothetical protein
VVVADLNGDRRSDLIVAEEALDDGPGRLTVRLGDGTGRFGRPRAYRPVPGDPSRVAVGRLNGDRRTDLVVLDPESFGRRARLRVLLGDGAGRLRRGASYRVGRSPGSVAVADFDRDGRADLAIGGMTAKDSVVHVRAGTGRGRFLRPTSFPLNRCHAAAYECGVGFDLMVGALNRDRRPDLLVGCRAFCRSGDGRGGVFVLLNKRR